MPHKILKYYKFPLFLQKHYLKYQNLNNISGNLAIVMMEKTS